MSLIFVLFIWTRVKLDKWKSAMDGVREAIAKVSAGILHLGSIYCMIMILWNLQYGCIIVH